MFQSGSRPCGRRGLGFISQWKMTKQAKKESDLNLLIRSRIAAQVESLLRRLARTLESKVL